MRNVETQNITLSLPKEILHKVKLIAVQRQTSVSRLLASVLEDLVFREEGYARARERHLDLLRRGVDLGTNGRVGWQREELHER